MFVTMAGIISKSAIFAWHVHVKMERREPTLVNAPRSQFETGQRQFTQLTLERIYREPSVDERAQNHIAARS